MIEALRGYAAAVLARAGAADQARRIAAELPVFAGALFGDEQLRAALTDDALPVATRRAVVEDLLREADPVTLRLVRYAVDHDRPAELPADVEWLARRAGWAAGEGASSDLSDLEPVVGRAGAQERLAGFAAALFEDLPARAVIEEVEDELFRFARTVEAEEPLRLALARQDLPLPLRQAIVSELLSGRAQDPTVRLATYAVAAGQGRGLVELLDWLVDQAAAERGLRVAEVRTAADLDGEQRQRLTAALRRMTGREVELRVSVDPSLLGGAMVTVGDTVIDGTVRRRLDQLRHDLNRGAGGPDATGGSR